jgi:hypothetical protein
MNEGKYLVKFNKSYSFEGTEYNEIDLSGIENLTAKDLMDVDRIYVSMGQDATARETTLTYACIIASKATGKPIEFFENLPARESIKIKNMVVGFFYNQG